MLPLHALRPPAPHHIPQTQPGAPPALAPPPPPHGLLRAAKEAEAERSLPRPAMAAAAARAAQLAPHEAELDAELDEAAEVREMYSAPV